MSSFGHTFSKKMKSNFCRSKKQGRKKNSFGIATGFKKVYRIIFTKGNTVLKG